MVLAEPRGVVAVVYKNVADRAGTPRNDGVIAGIAGGKLRDVAEADAVMVASGEQRRSRRRTQGGRVELVVANPALVNSIKVWRRDRPPEGACGAEAGVVGQDQQHIRSARRRVNGLRKSRLGLAGFTPDHAAKLRLGGRENRRNARRLRCVLRKRRTR